MRAETSRSRAMCRCKAAATSTARSAGSVATAAVKAPVVPIGRAPYSNGRARGNARGGKNRSEIALKNRRKWPLKAEDGSISGRRAPCPTARPKYPALLRDRHGRTEHRARRLLGRPAARSRGQRGHEPLRRSRGVRFDARHRGLSVHRAGLRRRLRRDERDHRRPDHVCSMGHSAFSNRRLGRVQERAGGRAPALGAAARALRRQRLRRSRATRTAIRRPTRRRTSPSRRG